MKMKNVLGALFIAVNMCAVANPAKQTADSLGLPGDNLNLYGVLDLFKRSETPEDFEKALNSSETKLNNLDLNGDGEIDYIRVIDRSENDMHAFVLQIPVDADESQDVAVIEVEKNSDGTAHLQIVGDEELYGKNYIIEPADENSKAAAPTATQPAQSQEASPSNQNSNTNISTTPPPPVVVNVWAWPAVRYVYRPAYVPWVSPWRWNYYPPYWKPWRPIHWGMYHPHWHPYRSHYHRVHTYRVIKTHDMYHRHRVVSKTVYQRRSVAPRPAPDIQQERRQVSPGRRDAPQHRQQKVQPRQRNSAPRGDQQRPRGGGKSGGKSNSGSQRSRK